MKTHYETRKGTIYRYKARHLERWREINNRASKKRYCWHRIQSVFLHILLDDTHASPSRM